MILAVQVFNSAGLKFKTEVFAVLANIAWTYLLHEYYERKGGVKIVQDNGWSLLLSQMIARQDCPLSGGVRKNLNDLKIIRDSVEHKMRGRADLKWMGLYQACCLNFDKALCELFGDQLTLAHELAFALQFTKMDIHGLAALNKCEIPPHIEAIDAELNDALTDEQRADLEYQFRVIYTLRAASKSRAHVEFVHPTSAEGKEIRNVLVRDKLADHTYPYKPKKVVELVEKRSGKKFSVPNHAQAWRFYQVRPLKGAKQPENTNKDYCVYHPAHRDYTYSEKWVDHLVEEIKDNDKFAAIKSTKIK